MGLFEEKIPHAPVFRPSEKEFADFQKFVYGLALRKEVQESGCVKVSSTDHPAAQL
jgi:hypothetical protein